MSRPPFTFTRIDGNIIAGSIPSCPADIEALHNLSVCEILTLTRRLPEEYPDMEAAFKRFSIGWIYAPIPDNGIPDDATLIRALDALERACIRDDEQIYVHCRGGIGRTGLILIAYYVLRRGLTVAEARDKVRVRRNYEGNATAADQGSPQREWIDALEKRDIQS